MNGPKPEESEFPNAERIIDIVIGRHGEHLVYRDRDVIIFQQSTSDYDVESSAPTGLDSPIPNRPNSGRRALIGIHEWCGGRLSIGANSAYSTSLGCDKPGCPFGITFYGRPRTYRELIERVESTFKSGELKPHQPMLDQPK